MKKLFSAVAILLLGLFATVQFASAQTQNLHDFTVTTIKGDKLDLSTLKGKKVLVVNVASKCGLTPQYEGLQALYDKYGDEDFTIVAFPANNFGEQEPGSEHEIQEFCTLNYGVKFPMMAKISVKGDDMAPIYHFLTEKAKNGVLDTEIQWNFQKFLIDENGNVVKTIHPRTDPMDDEIVEWIES